MIKIFKFLIFSLILFQLTKATIYILTSAVGAASCILPIVAYGMIPLDENGERVEGASISAGIMFAYAIIVGFCAGVLNCLIMACTGKIHLTSFDLEMTHLTQNDSFDLEMTHLYQK